MRAFMRFTGISVAILCFVLTSYSQNKPKATYMVGKSKVSVWETEKQGEFGKFTTKNFKIEKVYKKGKEWKTTNSFNLTELLQLRAAIDKAINEEGVIVKETDNPENKKLNKKKSSLTNIKWNEKVTELNKNQCCLRTNSKSTTICTVWN